MKSYWILAFYAAPMAVCAILMFYSPNFDPFTKGTVVQVAAEGFKITIAAFVGAVSAIAASSKG